MKKNRLIIILFAVLAITTAWLLFTRKSSTLNPVLKDFAVKDTAAIDKIFLADRQGNQVTLVRKGPGNWVVNNRFQAKNSCINTLLYTMMSLEVRSPVGKNLYNNTMKLMAATSVKTEIYVHGQLVKTYYVGHPTMDTQGTFMYLEGSSTPFIMWIPGFQGYLTTRYFAEQAAWRDPAIFRYERGGFTNIKVEDLARPTRSFNVEIVSDSSVKVTSLSLGSEIHPIDPLKIRTFLAAFHATSYDHPDRFLSQHQHDSLLKAGPFGRITVTERSGKLNQLRLYRLPIGDYSKFTGDGNGKDYQYDFDNFTAQLDGDTAWYVCQYYHFDRILKDPQNFTPGADKTPTQQRH